MVLGSCMSWGCARQAVALLIRPRQSVEAAPGDADAGDGAAVELQVVALDAVSEDDASLGHSRKRSRTGKPRRQVRSCATR